MRADLSRATFDASKHYAGVVLQQGRVLLDADFNEQGDIAAHREQVSTHDTVGASGAPRGDAGFEIGALGADLTISTGRMYVDGIALENDPHSTTATSVSATVLTLDEARLDDWVVAAGDALEVLAPAPVIAKITAIDGASLTLDTGHGVATGATVAVRRRPSLLRQPYTSAETLPAAAGRYLAVLRTRVVEASTIDEPAMAEPALGGPDTSVRQQLVWQVQLHPLAAGQTCSDWMPPARSGKLQPMLNAPAAGTGDCALPADAAYQSTENSLYRVEVNGVDPNTGTITSLLWDRDNASHASLITELGLTVTLEDFGHDAAHRFDGGQIVTVSDRHQEYAGGPLQVCTTSNPDDPKLQLSAAPARVDAGSRPRLRRWSGELTGVAPGTPVELEYGLSVVIDAPAVNDYWMIPARTALGGPGNLDWPLRDDGTYEAREPAVPDVHYAPLAVVDFDGTNFTVFKDCRIVFPPLTAITAADVSYDPSHCNLTATDVQGALDQLCARTGGSCTITVSAVDDWQSQLTVIPKGGDARLCFRAGTFTSAKRVVLAGTGHLIIEGLGRGTIVTATQDEIALQLDGWQSVTLRDISFSSTSGTDKASRKGMNGALTIAGSKVVVVDSVQATCAPGVAPQTTCVTIAGPASAATAGAEPGRVIVRDCSFGPGEYQVGLLVRDMTVVEISGVLVYPPAQRFTELSAMPRAMRELFRPQLFQGIIAANAATQKLPAPPPPLPAPPAPAPAPPMPFPAPAPFPTPAPEPAPTPGEVIDRPILTPRVERLATHTLVTQNDSPFVGTFTKPITVGPVVFHTPGPLAQPWRDAVAHLPAAATTSLARRQIYSVAKNVLGTVVKSDYSALRKAIDVRIVDRTPPIWQGIVVAGTQLGTVSISGCIIGQAIQGIHVATSKHEAAGGATPTQVQRVSVVGNTVNGLVPAESARSRHGIFVGNSQSVLVADNTVSLINEAINDRVPSDGIRVWGVLGRDVVVRDNHITNYPLGVRVMVLDPANANASRPARWVVRANFIDHATHGSVIAHTPSGQPAVSVVDNVQ